MSATAPELAAPAVEAEAARIRVLVERGRYAEALTAAERLVATAPASRDALYLVAVTQRHLQRIPDALMTLARLEALHPRFSRLYQERGLCYVALKDPARAIEAYQQAVSRNPALPASWNALQMLYRMVGQADSAALAASHVQVTAKLAPEVLAASGHFWDGDLDAAERMIRPYLLKHDRDVEAMRLLARIALERDAAHDADLLLEAVLELAPDYVAARYDYARALLQRHKYPAALAQLDILLQAAPDNRTYRTTYAAAQVGVGKHERALQLYRELLDGAPRPADIHLSIAHSLKTLGRQQESIDAYHAAAAVRPDFGDAYWSLANLKTYRFDDAELAQMRAAEAAATTAITDRYHLCFALGKALEDRGAYEESFRYYARGNALKRSETNYDADVTERNARLQQQVCTREFFAARAEFGCRSTAPIFIVGLPRSGSTLLEQILASHSQVEGTMELAEIPRLAQLLDGRGEGGPESRYPAVLARLAADEARRLGEQYLAGTLAYRTGRRFFIDKMPNNFRHIGLIHLILPNARIIDARREPMACCFSNFKQLFASGQEFTYSLEDIGRYYRAYVALMEHWDAVLPGKVLRVQHESVVDDLAGNVRRILAFCGLDFEPACLEFHKTERSVRTASSEQVRQPIFREGLDQWRHFEPWLGPLRTALGQ